MVVGNVASASRAARTVGDAFVTVGWNGGAFFGVDNRAITLLESSTGDTTPPTTPSGLNANVLGDGETWLSWGA